MISAELLKTMEPSTVPVEPPGPDGFPLLLSVRLPIPLVEKVRRSLRRRV
jgi:hypothetical protein